MNNTITSKAIQFIIALLIYIGFAFFVIKNIPTANFDMEFLLPYSKIIIQGWFYTILISLLSLMLSIVVGFIIFLSSRSKIHLIRYIGEIFNNIIFGSPLLVFILIIYYFIGTALNYDNRFVLGLIGLSLYMAPYMNSIFKGAIESIDKDQYIASKIFGFTKVQEYRYIIIPQILRILIPPLSANLTFVLKGSSILYVIGVPELFYSIRTAQANTYAFTEGYILMFLSYLIITIPLIRLTTHLERRIAEWN